MRDYSELRSYPIAILVPVLATLAGMGVEVVLHRGNISLLYLLAVLAVALRTSTKPALVCALVSFLLYNFFFTEPRFSLLMTDREDMLTISFFLLVAAIAGQQAVTLRQRVIDLQAFTRHQRLQVQLAQQVSAASSASQVHDALAKAVAEAISTDAVVLTLDAGIPVIASGTTTPLPETMENARLLLLGKITSAPDLLALNNGKESSAVLYVNSGGRDSLQASLEPLVQQANLALQRIRLAGEVQRERLDKEREMLRSALLSSVSHDLRTPLASMIGSATSLLDLRDSLSKSQERELLEAIVEEANRLDNYTRNLLDMTRLEHGALKLERDWVGIDEILSLVFKRLKPTLRGRKLITRIPTNLPLLFVHGTLIEHAIFNLLDNAVKYSAEGTNIEVEVSFTEAQATIYIKDGGPGIPESEREHIFDSFHSTSRGDHHRAGTGLGLSIARGMIAAHGGTLTLVNTDCHGTTFCITLPRGTPPALVQAQ